MTLKQIKLIIAFVHAVMDVNKYTTENSLARLRKIQKDLEESASS